MRNSSQKKAEFYFTHIYFPVYKNPDSQPKYRIKKKIKIDKISVSTKPIFPDYDFLFKKIPPRIDFSKEMS